MKREHSNQYFTEAQKLFPGGVNSPVRAFKAVGGHPLFIEKASGAYLHDVDGNRYIDYVLSWGPMILGHAPKDVLPAVDYLGGDQLWCSESQRNRSWPAGAGASAFHGKNADGQFGNGSDHERHSGSTWSDQAI